MAELIFQARNKKDRPIAEVVGGLESGTVVYLHTEKCCESCGPRCTRQKRCCKSCVGGCHDQSEQPMREVILPHEGGGKMVMIPKEQSEHGFVFGATGSGKSVFCCSYAAEYQRDHPDNPVYLVSYVDKDPSIDKIKDLIRIPFDDILEGTVSAKSIANSLIIFDDVDALPPPPEKKGDYEPKVVFAAVEALRDSLLTRGRHESISVLVTTHLGANFKHTKSPINESSFITVFPKGGNHKHIDYILGTYCGLKKDQLKRLVALPTYSVTLYKNPGYILYDKGVYLL